MKVIYEFEIFGLNEIEELYGKFRKYGVGKFLDLVYRKSIRSKSFDRDNDYLNNEGFVYVSKIEIERYLGNGRNKDGEYYWNVILKSLSKRGIVKYRRSGRNKFDYGKKLWFFKLNEKFFESKKNKREVEDRNLIKWLDKRNKVKEEKWLGLKEVGDKKLVDRFIKYEIDVCRRSDLVIDDLDSVIDLRIGNKIREVKERSEWLWISKKEKSVLVDKLFNEEVWLNGYKRELREKYEIVKDDIKYLKSGEYGELSDDYFKRDEFGGRIYNVYSNVIREYRRFIKIDGEDVVEIDLKNSMICCLYWMIKLLLDGNEFNENSGRINEIYWKLNELNNGYENEDDRDIRLGLSYMERWSYIMDKSKDLNKDYYNFLSEEFEIGNGYKLSRSSFKELLFVILFGSEKKLGSLRLGENNYSELESLLLGGSRFLISDLKKIDLFSWYKNREYKKYKNVSLILMRLERKIMDVMSNIMIVNGFDYLSLFDGFMVKKSDSKRILEVLNNELERIDKIFRLELK